MTTAPNRKSRDGIRISLRTAVTLLVLLTHSLAFGVGYVWTLRAERRIDQDRLGAQSALLGVLVGTLVDSRGNLRSAALLQWRHWKDWFEDVQLVHFPDLVDRSRPSRGVRLNPLGSARRSVRFDDAGVERAMRTAASSLQAVAFEGGDAWPVVLPDGRVWGGCWMRIKPPEGATGVMAQFLPWLLASTLLLTLTTLSLVGRLLIDPVRRLATVAGRIEGGDHRARAGPSVRKDELGDLLRQFDRMADEVTRYRERLEDEVRVATSAARAAEAAAMTQRRLAATGELAAGVAHEINNPLGGLVNAVQALAREDLPAGRRREYLDLIQGGLERIRLTVGRLLRLAPRETATTQMALGGALADALGLVAHRAAAGSVPIELVVESEDGQRTALFGTPAAQELLALLPTLRGQANELGQALLNLLVNALDALEALPKGSGRIMVQCATGEKLATITIKDNGPGAGKGVLERAGDVFFTTKDPGRGTGLGLAIVHRVAAAHGGRLELASQEGRGFEARLVLPLEGLL